MAAKSAMNHSGELKPKMQTEWNRSRPRRMKARAHTWTSCRYCLYVHLTHCHAENLIRLRQCVNECRGKQFTCPSRLTQRAGLSMWRETVRCSRVGIDKGGMDPIPRSSILSLTAPVADVQTYESAGNSWSGPVKSVTSARRTQKKNKINKHGKKMEKKANDPTTRHCGQTKARERKRNKIPS